MDDQKPSAFADFISGLVWLGLALAIVIGSWQMDRLEHLKVSLYTAPGLVPGLLGLALLIMALLLILRSLRAGALSEAKLPSFSLAEHWRLLVALALCLTFALGMLGSGLPFWLAAAIFISAFVFVFQFEDRRQTGSLLKGAALSAAFGLICGATIHFVFQDLFLVRLP
jgi:hypothetical protein